MKKFISHAFQNSFSVWCKFPYYNTSTYKTVSLESYCTNNIFNKCNIFVLPITGLKKSSVTRLWLTVWTDEAARWTRLKRRVSFGYRRRMTSSRALWASFWRPSMTNKALNPWIAVTNKEKFPFKLTPHIQQSSVAVETQLIEKLSYLG